MAESLRFDRAAGYYDATRGRSPAGIARETAVLAAELAGRGPALEVGVGTGQVALPLAAAGVRVVGIDLSWPMLEVLVAKAGGVTDVPIVRADATRMPFPDDAFGGAYLRWVLHLIPDWRAALGEMARVVRPGGVALISLGGGDDGPREAIQTEFARRAGVPRKPGGLDWHGHEELDAAMAGLGAAGRDLPAFSDDERMTVEEFMVAIGDGAFSWTWALEDDQRHRVADEVRAWAEARYGPLADLPNRSYEVAWRAYDLP
jgi:SAM-dependent methyltransferase